MNLSWLMCRVSSALCCPSMSFTAIVFPILSVLLLFQAFVFCNSAISCFSWLSNPLLIEFHLFFYSPLKLLAQRPLFSPCPIQYRLLSHHLIEWWGSLLPSPTFLMSVLLCFPLTFSPSLCLSVSPSLSLCGVKWGGVLIWDVFTDLHVPCVGHNELWHTLTSILHLPKHQVRDCLELGLHKTNWGLEKLEHGRKVLRGWEQ